MPCVLHRLALTPCTHAHHRPAGSHTLTITKITEAMWGSAWLESIALEPSGAFLPPPPPSPRRIMFIGDSYT